MARPGQAPRFIQTKPFSSNWDRLGLKDDDLRAVESTIADNFAIGDVVKGTNGVRKLRIPRRGAGKSGGFRVFYVAFPEYGTVFLVGLLSKNEEGNITAADRNAMAATVAGYERALKKQNGEKS